MSKFISIQMPSINSEPISKKIIYEEISPNSRINDTVSCYFKFSSKDLGKDSCKIHMIPDGCINILIDLNCDTVETSSVILGPLTNLAKYEINSTTNIFGIRILPGKFANLTNIPIKDIANKQFLLKDIITDFYKYVPQNMEGIDGNTLAESIDTYGSEYFRNTISCDNEDIISNTTKYIYDKKGQVSIKELTKMINYSSRTLTRRYDNVIGINPKLFCRIVRFQNTLYSIKDKKNLDWKIVALDNGYYDQPHLIKEFKFFCGASPSFIL